jgi:periplasmic copper chaperone A
MKAVPLFASFLFAATSFAVAAEAGLRVEQAWARPTPPGAKVGGVYLQIRSSGTADRLLSASSAAAAAVELHTHVMDGDVASMRALPGIDLPADAMVELKPSGLHLMLIGLKAPLKPGQKLPLKLRFAKAGEKAVVVEVGEPAANAASNASAPHSGHAGH